MQNRNCVRPKSRHGRNGLGFHQYEVLWRVLESEPCYGHVYADGTRFRQRANEIFGRRIQRINSWETDPTVYYQSPFVPKPHYDPGYFLPKNRHQRIERP